MFTVDKTTLPRFWYAHSGRIVERLGKPRNDHEFDNRADAHEYASATKQRNLQREYDQINNRVSGLQRRVYAIRALWNSRIREGLATYLEKVAAAKAALDDGPTVKVELLPDLIPVKGDRIPLGTSVYIVDSWGLKIERKIVTSEQIVYYESPSDGSAATYYLDDTNSYVDSTLNSTYSNTHYYLDKNLATEHIRNLMNDRIEKINNQIKAL